MKKINYARDLLNPERPWDDAGEFLEKKLIVIPLYYRVYNDLITVIHIKMLDM